MGPQVVKEKIKRQLDTATFIYVRLLTQGGQGGPPGPPGLWAWPPPWALRGPAARPPWPSMS